MLRGMLGRGRWVSCCLLALLLATTGLGSASASHWGAQQRTAYGPSPSGSGKYASGAAWVRFQSSDAWIKLERVSLRGSLGGTCTSSNYYWENTKTTVRNGNNSLVFSGSSLSNKTNCNATDPGAVVAFDMSNTTATGKFVIYIENFISVDNPFSAPLNMRVQNKKVQVLNGSVWQTLPVENTAP